MARRYSRVSNYSIGQTFRMFVFAVVGFAGSMWILPSTRWPLTPQDRVIISFVVAVLAAALAKRYT